MSRRYDKIFIATKALHLGVIQRGKTKLHINITLQSNWIAIVIEKLLTEMFFQPEYDFTNQYPLRAKEGKAGGWLQPKTRS